MVKTATHRVRFRFFDLSGLPGQGIPQFPVNCWRATFIVSGFPGDTIMDGARFGEVTDYGVSGQTSAITFVVGGVFMPDGSPAILDQRLLIDRAVRMSGIVVCEYLEPL